MTGVLLAAWLAERGVDVMLLERDRLGAGATGMGAGLMLQGLHYPYSVARKVLGAERVRDLWRLTAESQRLVEEFEVPCDLRRCGSRRVGTQPFEVEALQQSAAQLRADGFDGAWTGDALQVAADLALDPVAFVRGVAERSKARFREGVAAVGLDDETPQLRVLTEQGDVCCEAVALANDGEAGTLHSFFGSIIFPGRRTFRLSPPQPPQTVPVPTVNASGRELSYQRPDGRVLSLGESSAYPVEREWIQRLGFSCDELPNVGPAPGSVRIFVCAGFHGNALGPACAKMLSEILLTGKSDYPYRMLDPRRHAL